MRGRVMSRLIHSQVFDERSVFRNPARRVHVQLLDQYRLDQLEYDRQQLGDDWDLHRFGYLLHSFRQRFHVGTFNMVSGTVKQTPKTGARCDQNHESGKYATGGQSTRGRMITGSAD